MLKEISFVALTRPPQRSSVLFSRSSRPPQVHMTHKCRIMDPWSIPYPSSTLLTCNTSSHSQIWCWRHSHVLLSLTGMCHPWPLECLCTIGSYGKGNYIEGRYKTHNILADAEQPDSICSLVSKTKYTLLFQYNMQSS